MYGNLKIGEHKLLPPGQDIQYPNETLRGIRASFAQWIGRGAETMGGINYIWYEGEQHITLQEFYHRLSQRLCSPFLM
jgi:hypothetical protein